MFPLILRLKPLATDTNRPGDQDMASVSSKYPITSYSDLPADRHCMLPCYRPMHVEPYPAFQVIVKPWLNHGLVMVKPCFLDMVDHGWTMK